MAEDGEIVSAEILEQSDSDEDYYIGADDFDENDALTNGVMMGLEWDTVKQMMYNGFGHLLAQGYPSPESYMEHMREKEKQEKMMQNSKQPLPNMGQMHGAPQIPEFASFPTSQMHFPPLNAAYNPMVVLPMQEMAFRGGRGRGRGGSRPNNRGLSRPNRNRQGQRKRRGPITKKDSDHMNLANEDCRFYLASSCSKGVECTYRHCAEAKNTSAICESWQVGSKCEDPSKCKFLHPTKQPEAKICHFFTRGICKNGNSCKFLHEVAEEQENEPKETTSQGELNSDSRKEESKN